MWFVFTDIEGSTRLWREHGAVMGECLARHDALVRLILEEHGGRLVKHTGDGAFAVFEGGGALAFGLAFQRRLRGEDWGDIGGLPVKVAITAGPAEERAGDYFGPTVNRAARLVEAAWGGQVVVTEPVLEGVEIPPGAEVRDLGVHLFQDSGAPERVHQVSSPDLAIQDFPPLKSLDARPGNLPTQPTPFIGRERELAELMELIDSPPYRLVTLTGPGGVGKTRLALRLADEIADRFPWGACCVPMASLASPEFLVGAIATALRMSFTGRRPARTQLLDYLTDKHVLLILDNFEHLLPGAVLVGEILEAAPGVRIIATSRERLHLHGELVYEVEGMSQPKTSVDDAFEDYCATRLLVEAVRRVERSFRLTMEDRPAVLRICRVAGGLPLAIELAASWVKALSISELAAQLEKGLVELEGALADAPDRHRSLRAVFDHSYSLLSDAERRVVERLSVFRGGCTLEAACEVADARVPILAALIDKSLVRRTAAGRYELHEFVRAYAGERLATRGSEFDETALKHMAFYLGFLRSRSAPVHGPPTRKASEEVAVEIDNIRLAWDTAVRLRDETMLADAAPSMAAYYLTIALKEEGEKAFARAINALEELGPDDGPRDLASAVLRIRRGQALGLLGRFPQAAACLRKGLASAARAGDHHEIAAGLFALGTACSRANIMRRAVLLHAAATRIFRQLEDKRGLSMSLGGLGLTLRRMGDHQGAAEALREGVAVARATGDLRQIVFETMNLAATVGDLGDMHEGKALLKEAVRVARQLADSRLISFALGNLGRFAMLMGDYSEARRHLEESLQLKREVNDPEFEPITCANLAHVANLEGHHDEARQWAELGLQARSSPGSHRPANCLTQLAWSRLRLGDVAGCREALTELANRPAPLTFPPRLAETLIVFAMLAVTRGDMAKGIEIAAAVRAHPPDHATGDWSTRLLADWSARCGPDHAAAAEERGGAMDWRVLFEEARAELAC